MPRVYIESSNFGEGLPASYGMRILVARYAVHIDVNCCNQTISRFCGKISGANRSSASCFIQPYQATFMKNSKLLFRTAALVIVIAAALSVGVSRGADG